MDTHSIWRPPSAFTALPYELLYIIFSFLTRPDLLNQCYIRRFRNVAQDVLYQEFHTDGQNIAWFLRTVFLNKTLACRVRRVYITQSYYHRYVQYPESFVAFLTQHLLHLDIPLHVKELWSQQITHRKALATLLLAYLPKLEKLQIFSTDENARYTGISEWILSQKQPFWTLLMPKMPSMTTSLVKASFLRNVKELSLEGVSCSVCDLAEVFSLPSLRSLRIERVVHSQRDKRLTGSAFTPRSNSILRLALNESEVSRQTLEQILHSCTALEDFTYGELWDVETADPRLVQDFDSLIKILSPFHDTLKTLIFQNQDPFPSEISPIRTLSQFTTLERFSTATFALIGDGSQTRDVFPKSLIELKLKDTLSRMLEDHNDIDKVIREYAEAKLNFLPNLRKLSLTLDKAWWEYSYLEFPKCSKNGVEFCMKIGELW
jgi:hypothetical protein